MILRKLLLFIGANGYLDRVKAVRNFLFLTPLPALKLYYTIYDANAKLLELSSFSSEVAFVVII